VNKSKAQREFVVVTLIALISIALIIAVYATLLGTFTGEEVLYGTGLTGEVLYSIGNQTAAGNWTNTMNITDGTAWYACLNITSTNGYIGQVNVTFQLQQKNGSWADQGSATYAVLNLNGTVGERVYVSSSGVITSNRDWQPICTAGYAFHVKATVETTG